jgi:hypothetical protein
MTLVCRGEHKAYEHQPVGPVLNHKEEVRLFPRFKSLYFCTCLHCNSTFAYEKREVLVARYSGLLWKIITKILNLGLGN